MLFSAGFGAGLVFWGVAEPMSHFFTPPFQSLEPQTEATARVAMGYAFFHWGISQWSVFAIVGLMIAFLQFRRGKDGLVSTAVEPALGSNPIVKNTIDSFAVIATVMGIATSLGLGILQMAGGLKSVFQIPNSIWLQLGITLIIVVLYLLSSSTGLNKGIR
jgi:glycine betaine transporter